MKIVKFLLFMIILVGLGGAGAAGLAIWYFGRDLPDYQALASYQPPVVSRVYADDGRLMAEYATEKRVFVPVTAMPPLLIHAFLAAEDKNFYNEPGIDPLSIIRAGFTDLIHLGSGRRPIGASTITQQVAKNFLLNDQVSLARKIKEALIALRMEQVMSKNRILELYLNEIYLGDGAYGVAAAALNYFDKSLDQLTPAEAAFLGALPKAPNNYNPVRHPHAAKDRRDWVLDRMVDAGFLTQAQANAAKATPITLHHRSPADIVNAPYFSEEVRRELLERYGEKTLYTAGLAVRTSLDPKLQYYAVTALRDALIAYDRRHGYRGPLAHLDMNGDWATQLKAMPLPAGAESAGWDLAAVTGVSSAGASIALADGARGQIPFDEMRWARKELPNARVGIAPSRPSQVLAAGDVVLVKPLKPASSAAAARYGLEQIPEVSGAFVAIDPNTGRVLALDGGFSYEISQFDRATQAMRQTGSAVKPFIYLAALDHGFTPSTMVLDEPFVVDQGPGLPKWNPTNYEHNFNGPVPLMVGLAKSLNLVTARVGAAIGLDTVADYLVNRFHILDQMPHEYSYVLGAGETTLLRLTTAYAELDNGGKRLSPTFIDRVQDRNGVTIYRADNRACPDCDNVAWTGQAPPDLPDNREQIADPRSIYQDVAMMEGVIQRGTGRDVAVVGKPLAGKTGTTNGPNDAWFVGFSPNLVAGVYVGFDQPHTLGRNEQGATVAAPAFRDFMIQALKDQPAIPFRIPPGLRLVRVNPETGRLARPGERNAIYMPYKPGTEPSSEGPGMIVSGGVPSETPADDSGAGQPQTQAVPASGTGGLY